MRNVADRESKDRITTSTTLLCRLFQDRSLRLRPAADALHIPLRSSPRLRIARRGLGIAMLLYIVELLLTGHWIAVPAIVLLGACGWPWKARAGASSETPPYLVLATDGRLFLKGSEAVHEVWLRPESLRLGAHVLLVLAVPGRTIRLLLGPDNLAPAELAALKCRLPAGPEPRGTALHSAAASRRSDLP